MNQSEPSEDKKIADWAYSKLTPDTLLDCLETLGWQCDGRLLALNSYENRVYQVGIEDQDPVIAKFYRPSRWSNSQLAEEQQFVLELENAEIPVIAPILAPATGLALNQTHGFNITVYPRRGGYPLEIDQPDQLFRVGQILAQLHNVGAKQPFLSRPQLSVDEFGHQAVKIVLDSGIVPKELQHNYQSLTAQLLGLISHQIEQHNEVQSLRLHGDCHVSNILMREDRLLLVDFDDARSGPAIQDLWMFLAGDDNAKRAALSELLEGYEEFRPFNQRELNLIEPLRSLRQIHYAAWLTKRRDDPAFQLAFPWFYSVKFWEEHILTLREQIVAIQEPVIKLY